MRSTISSLTLGISLGAVLTFGSAGAQSLSAAQSKLDSGDWQGAAKAATALNTSDGYALAAKATTLGAGLGGNGKTLYQQAQGYAQKAIGMNKNNAAAYFELARAQGRLALSTGLLQSLGLANSVKANLQKAIGLNPNMANAYAGLGLWHAELSAKGAAARAATGARADQAIPNFEKAVRLEPNNVSTRMEYARGLMALGASNKTQAVAQLKKAVALPAKTFWEKRDQQIAQQMLAKLN